MNHIAEAQVTASYKFYFPPDSTSSFPKSINNKENLQVLGNKLPYKFYFKQPLSSKEKTQKIEKEKRKLSQRRRIIWDVSKTVSELNNYAEIADVSFQSLLGAVAILYKFMSVKEHNSEEFSALILSCLFISSKLFEINELSASELSSLTGDNVSKQEILRLEGIIIEELQFDLFSESACQINRMLTTQSEEIKEQMFMMIQMTLLKGEELFTDKSLFLCIQKCIIDEDSVDETEKLKRFFQPLSRSCELRSLIMKWSFKINADSLLSKLSLL